MKKLKANRYGTTWLPRLEQQDTPKQSLLPTALMHVYRVRPRKHHRGVDLISDALPFGRLWYDGPNAIGYAMHSSRSHDAVIRVYDAADNVIETHEHKGEFKTETKSRHVDES
jgi:hypothetical protein